MTSTQGQVGEEWPAGICLLLIAYVRYGFVNQVFGQVIALFAGNGNERVILNQQRGKLIGFTTKKTIKSLKTHP